jgi:transposase
MPYKHYIGLDVHRASTSYIVRDPVGTVLLEGSCASQPKDVYDVLEPYLPRGVVGMECNTEVYPLYHYLRHRRCEVRVANTLKIRTLVGATDALDARRLSDMLRLDSFPCSYIPEERIASLRRMVRCRHGVLEEFVRIQMRIKALLRFHGLAMPKGDSFTKGWCRTLGCHLAKNPGLFELRCQFDLYLMMTSKIEYIDAELTARARQQFPREMAALTALRGIGDLLASYILAEVMPVNRFASEKKLRRYAGVVPCTDVSGGKSYGTYLPKGSSRPLLRWAIGQAAVSMVKCDEAMKAYYQKKKKQKKVAKKALMSVSRCITDKVYTTLKNAQ